MQERSKIKANRESYSTLPGRLCANPTKAANASPYQVNWCGLWASAKAAVIKLKIARGIVPCGYVRQIVSLVCDDFCIFDEGKGKRVTLLASRHYACSLWGTPTHQQF